MKRSGERKEESGQIIVLLAISLLVLLVVAALAVDGGMVYTERRFAQNAADASSLAGASRIANELVDHDIYYSNFTCSGVAQEIAAGVSEAQVRAATNNFASIPLVGDSTTNHGIYVYCNEELNNKYIDFYVTLTTDTPTSFLHLIDRNVLTSTVQAVTRFYPQYDLGYGNAIVSLNEECFNPQDGLQFSGTTEINITGGGIWSNACIRINGPPNDVSPLVINIDPPSAGANFISDLNLINGTLNADQNNIAEEYAIDLENDAGVLKDILESICPASSDGNVSIHNNEVEPLSPGTYDRLSMNGGELVFNTGSGTPLYCFNDNVTINGGIVNSALTPAIIYLRNGNLTISANAEVHLVAPNAPDDTPYDQLDGLLIFVNPDTTVDVSLEGDGTSYFAGTIFNLNGDVVIGGNPSAESEDGVQVYSTQIIGYNVDIHGNVEIDINFDLENVTIMDSYLYLLR